ncbi:MAG: hypothetical protein ABL959_09790 [Pyrinomonadaceae bacterium]
MQIYKTVVNPCLTALLAAVILGGTACQSPLFDKKEPVKVSMGDTPAVRLNYRYESDVPVPTIEQSQSAEERNPAIQADFDSNRLTELLDKTIVSPDKKRIVAVYHRISDLSSEYRLDMYTSDGKLLKKMTADSMAVHFPDTIVWSPDSTLVAFVAMIRVADPMAGLTLPTPSVTPIASDANTAIDAITDPATAPMTTPTAAAPTGILTFRTEQIYLCGADGGGVKPITQNDGLIYFYYTWSPDSSMLVAMAATAREWRYIEVLADQKGEMMVPQGRLRVIEKNGRERRLDDNLTAVRPVWSPDSAKIAAAFETQVRIYDAVGTNPTQAAIPLRNQLLISSQAYDRNQQRASQAGNTDANAPVSTPEPNEPVSTLPDEKLLVSYNPIVEIAWTAEDLLYLQTAYLRRMRTETDSVRSFSRWHRLILTTQATATPAKQ